MCVSVCVSARGPVLTVSYWQVLAMYGFTVVGADRTVDWEDEKLPAELDMSGMQEEVDE